MAVQRQAVHADVSSDPSAAPATIAAHGSPWSTASDAASDLRGGSRCTSGAWLHLRLSSIRIPWSDGSAHDAWNGPSSPWRIHPWSLHATYALPYAPTECYVPFDTDGSDASVWNAPSSPAWLVPSPTKRRRPPSINAPNPYPVARASLLPPPKPSTATCDAVPDDDAPAGPAASVRPQRAAAAACAHGWPRLGSVRRCHVGVVGRGARRV
ncbi:hypothetical protein L226DRAFT_64993 [Lentinus tigrinus ALCF2SS1-7]|uniref:uncharacterized protein n=1 Tax=Lentinus tigrinus ALCF2SS1-7 TaxID=1328758 RepID=UPI001165F3A5|nr:hypothetical protein L226DRAFT_64993 [Lentinus tigrinus ALCF2SS1-7]